MAGQHSDEAYAGVMAHPTHIYEHEDDSDTAGARKRVQLYARDESTGDPVQLTATSDGKLNLGGTISCSIDNVGLINSSDVRINPATEDKQDDTIAEIHKTVGFDKNSDITTSIVKAGYTTTITETDGVKILTTIIDETDPNNISITEVWS